MPQDFYFMEMNTRLQVEHPVTELISGIDLVEWQLRVAQGEPLPAQTDDLTLAAMRSRRVCMRKIPRTTICRASAASRTCAGPQALPEVRQDTGVEEGDEVSSYYDPMLGKIIAWGESRVAAIDRLRRALSEIEIVGVATNRALLCSVLGDEEFRARRGGHEFSERSPRTIAFRRGAACGCRYRVGGGLVCGAAYRPQCALAGHPRLAARGAGEHHLAVRMSAL